MARVLQFSAYSVVKQFVKRSDVTYGTALVS
jgi:hypothetical protein